ncbi:ATP-binding cassette, subfamily C [Sinosporangium album]|uniref:ATP-binding cassette, subfamily C n=1 Tax=Sinosporangium album TaxID=504805 RepID=A0A1G8KLG9_9ACTN|nr:ABC transporter ATP-binding protein [Sinosporangium album]SDI44222.1 ATP-binding cassette, subfamily C [Sinosporangium album]
MSLDTDLNTDLKADPDTGARRPDESLEALMPVATTAQTRRAAMALLRPHRGLVALAAALLTAATLTGLATPMLLGHLVDVVIEGEDVTRLITLTGVALAGVAALSAVLNAVSHYYVIRAGEQAAAGLREEVMEHALNLPLAQVERAGRGDLVSRVTSDVRVVTSATSEVLPKFVSALLTVGLTIVGLGVLDWRFAVAALLAVPIQARALVWYLRRSKPIYAAERAAEGQMAGRVLDSVGAADTVTALRLGPAHLRAAEDKSNAVVSLSLRTVVLITRFYGRLNLAELVGLSAVLVAGFFLVSDKSVTVGAATAAALFFHRLFSPIGQLLGLFDDLQEAGAGLARLVGVTLVERRPEPADPPAPRDASVAADGLVFGYRDGRDVLSGVSLAIEPGERVAVVGTTGAGKSSLVRVLAGVHEPRHGSVLLGGVPRAELGMYGTSRAIAMVTQEVHVFAGTVADDLRLAAGPDAGDGELLAALEAVGARSWVEALPDGLRTRVGEGAWSLTATQAQQLALARLMLVPAQIVVLDEATAEAGSSGALALEASAEAVMRGRTAIVVAHRLQQAARADRVIVMSEGRIVEQGTHDDLAVGTGVYARLWAAWSDTRPAQAPTDQRGSAISGGNVK